MSNMNSDAVIKVKNVSKVFRIPHEKITTIGGHFVNIFRKKTYEEFHALKNISFEIKKGEFVGIIGKNGSGKSTLLKMLAGIYQSDGGSVEVNGEMSPFLELGIGFNPELSGRDNVYLNGAILGMGKKELDNVFDEIVAFAELERFIDQKLKNYSSGMQVRLAFSVSVHAKKDILLMDEVLAVGDANFQMKCINKMEEYIKENKTVVIVSHDMGAIAHYCSKVIFLESGKVAFEGTPSEAIVEYMYQDVVPLEKKSDKKSMQEVRVKDVKVIGKIEHGKNMNIEVTYEISKQMTDLIFGIIIRNELKQDVFVTNTYVEKIKTGIIEPGDIKVRFQILNYLSSGKYTISPAVCDKSQRTFYDWRDNLSTFVIRNQNRIISQGGIDLPHSIELIK